MADLKPLEHRQYAHCESGVVTALLKRHGLDLSEPMVFGITGGLTFAYHSLDQNHQHACHFVPHVPRVDHQGGGKKPRCPIQDQEISGKRKRPLPNSLSLVDGGEIVGLQTSVYWLPYFPPEMRFQFNAHNLIVYGREGKNFSSATPFLNTPSGSRRRISRTPVSPRGPLPRRVSFTIPSGSIPPSI